MIITLLEEQKNNKNRVSVFVDGKFCFGLLKTDAEFFKLQEGKEISKETFDYISETIVYINAQETAVNFLSRRLKTEKEVRQKLYEKDFSKEITDRVIEFLIKYKYVDDENYANAYIRECKKLKPKSKRAVKFELSKRGIDKRIIETALIQNEIDEVLDCSRLIKKRTDGFLDIPFDKKKKITTYLLGKGYDYETVNSAFSLLKEKQEDDYGI